MIILFKYYVNVENCERFRGFGYIYIYIYRLHVYDMGSNGDMLLTSLNFDLENCKDQKN